MPDDFKREKMIRALVEILFSCALFVNAVLYIPQAVKLYKTKRSQGLSLFMFAGFSVIQLLTILHAYFERDWILRRVYSSVSYVRSDNAAIGFVPERLSGLETVGENVKQNTKKMHGLKRWIFPMLGIFVIVLLIFAGNFFHPKQVGSELEELPIPEELKEQGEPELTKLNADPEVKEGW